MDTMFAVQISDSIDFQFSLGDKTQIGKKYQHVWTNPYMFENRYVTHYPKVLAAPTIRTHIYHGWFFSCLDGCRWVEPA